MRILYENASIGAYCPTCRRDSVFVMVGGNGSFLQVDKGRKFSHGSYRRTLYHFMRCEICHRGTLATIVANNKVADGMIIDFYPVGFSPVKIPDDVPQGIVNEFIEAQRCASFGAWRAASAMLRSTLEKTLKENAFIRRQLIDNIDDAADDGIITESRRKKAHQDIRVLGNDVLHEEWKEVTEPEVETALHYTQRIIEDFYDDRNAVEDILQQKGRKLKTIHLSMSDVQNESRKAIVIRVENIQISLPKSQIIIEEKEDEIDIVLTYRLYEDKFPHETG